MSIIKPFSGTSKTITEASSLNNDISIDQLIDIDKNLDLYDRKQLAELNPKILYQTGKFSFNAQVINTTREVSISCVGIDYVNLDLFHQETIDKIKKTGKSKAHLGLIVIG